MSSLFEFIKKFEGFRAEPYNDGVDKTTIGDGFNIMENKIALQAVFRVMGIPVEWNGNAFVSSPLYTVNEQGEQVRDTAAERALAGYVDDINKAVDARPINQTTEEKIMDNSSKRDLIIEAAKTYRSIVSDVVDYLSIKG